MKGFIPQIQPWIDNSELEQLKRVIESTYVTEHALTEEFEDMIKDLTGTKYAIAITNGTAALYCCLKSLDIGPGDEVIVPNMTFVASSNAVIMAGATPVFCEVLEDTFCIDPVEVEKLINKSTKAVMPVHLYGQSAEMDNLVSLAERHSIYIIEDAAQGVGVKYNGQHVGTFGEMGILSFYGNKTITCGEGGIILTDSEKLRDRCYQLKNHGRPVRGTFKHEHIGFNFAFTEMQAAIGIAQLKKLPRIIQRKKEINELYHKHFKPLAGKLDEVYVDERCQAVWWFTSFLTKNKLELQQFLKEKGIQTRDFFYPLHMQPCYSDMDIKGNFSLSEKIHSQGISLPSSYGLTLEEQNYIIESVFDFFKREL